LVALVLAVKVFCFCTLAVTAIALDGLAVLFLLCGRSWQAIKA
jgi:hypothetical protein